MRKLGVYDALAAKIVRGTNVVQAFQFVETGNAELGIVAFSQLANRDGGSRWVIPEHLHAALAQDAVLLKNGAGNAAAVAFVDFLRSEERRVGKGGVSTGNSRWARD